VQLIFIHLAIGKILAYAENTHYLPLLGRVLLASGAKKMTLRVAISINSVSVSIQLCAETGGAVTFIMPKVIELMAHKK
jgi:hypothetical protein